MNPHVCTSGKSIYFGAAERLKCWVPLGPSPECSCRASFNHTWDFVTKSYMQAHKTLAFVEKLSSHCLPCLKERILSSTIPKTLRDLYLAFSISVMDKFNYPMYFSDVLFHAVPSAQCHYTCLGVYLWWDPEGQKLRQNTKSSFHSWTGHNEHFPANYRGPVRLGLGKHRNESER